MSGTGSAATGPAPEVLVQDVVSACRVLAARGVVPGTAGNVSVRAGDVVAVTATGLVLADATPDDVTLVGLDGTVVAGRYAPTSELALHLAVHAARGDGALVHTHAPASTAAGTLVDDVLPTVHYAALDLGGPVRVAGYATFGTPELAAGVLAALDGRTGALMANHGAVTWGADLAAATARSEVLEWLCDVWLRASAAGTPRVLDDAALAAVAEQIARRGYGTVRSLPSEDLGP